LLFTSSAGSIKELEIDVLLQHYHRHLHENLIKLNYGLPIPSLSQIHGLFLKRGLIGVIYSFLLLPMRFTQDVPQDLRGLIRETSEALSYRRNLFRNPTMIERFRFLLNYFDRKGMLD